MDMNDLELQAQRKLIVDELEACKRPDMDKMIAWLDEFGFFSLVDGSHAALKLLPNFFDANFGGSCCRFSSRGSGYALRSGKRYQPR